MTKPTKPVIHARDHEHGGADPVRIVWESTGEAGAGGGIMFDTDNEGGWLQISTNDPNPDTTIGMDLFDDSGGGISIASRGAGGVTIETTSTAGGITLLEDGSSAGYGILIQSIRSDIRIDPGLAKNVILLHIPTSDPGVTGALWNDGGTLKIS